MINKKEKKCRYCKMFKGCSLINDSDNIIENYAEQCDYYCVEEKEVNLKKYSQKEKDDFINESCKVLNNIGERDTERIIKNPDENAKFLNGGICDMSKVVPPSEQEDCIICNADFVFLCPRHDADLIKKDLLSNLKKELDKKLNDIQDKASDYRASCKGQIEKKYWLGSCQIINEIKEEFDKIIEKVQG